MTRSTLSLLAVFCLLPLPVAAQTLGLRLENQAGPILTDPVMEENFKIVVRGPAGMWVYVHTNVSLEDDGSARAGELLQTRPWLQRPAWDLEQHMESGRVVAGSPLLHQDIEWVLSLHSRVVGNGNPDAVRTYHQPVLEDVAGTPVARQWDTEPDTWLVNGPPPASHPMLSIWKKVLEYPQTGGPIFNNTTVFSADRLAESALKFQAPTAGAHEQFMANDYYDALSIGLTLDVQAIGIIGADVTGGGLTDALSPGLLGLGLELPRVSLASTVRVRLSPGISEPVGGPGFMYNAEPYGPIATNDGDLVIPLTENIPPYTAVIKQMGGKPMRYEGKWAGPGLARFNIPLLPAGTKIRILALTNPIGTKYADAASTWDRLYIDDISQVNQP